jgi:hypothetical protein
VTSSEHYSYFNQGLVYLAVARLTKRPEEFFKDPDEFPATDSGSHAIKHRSDALNNSI